MPTSLKAVLIFLLLFIQLLFAAPQPAEFDPLFREAVRQYRAGLKQESLRAFRELHKDFPDSLSAIRWLGKIYLEREDWDNAKDWYDKIIDRREGDIEAHYFRGICYRETGKYKAFILQSRDWRRAEQNFTFVIDSLGTYKDIFYQYALLKKYWEDYPRAVELAEQQMAHQPKAAAFAGVYRFYESFLFNKPKDFRPWLMARPGLRNRLFLGEYFRNDEMPQKADSIFAALETDADLGDARVPFYIARAKAKYQLGQQDSCQYFYERAITSVQDSVDAALLFEDVKYVLADEELAQYRGLAAPELKREFFRRLWLARDPMPAAGINYRLIEHVRRVIFAEKQFYFDRFRTPANNPDKLGYLEFPQVFALNDKFNDKGLVYIRHGEPDDRSFYVNAGVPLNESWLYQPRGQLNTKLIFHFWQDENQAGNNWRFIASLPPYMAESRLHFDPIYGRMFTANSLEAISLEHEMRMQAHELVKIGMDTDQHSWKKELRSIFFPMYLATFRDDANRTRCELYFSLSEQDVLPEKAPHTATDSVTLNFAVFDLNYAQLKQVDKKIIVRDILDTARAIGFWPAQFDFVGPPTSYFFSVDVRTPGDEALGGYKFRFNASDYTTNGLKMSGIVLANAIHNAEEQNSFYKNGLTVVPNAGKIFSRKKPLNIYFELYNIPVQPDRTQTFMVDYTVRLLEDRTQGVLQKIGRIFRNPQPSVSNRMERTSSKPTSVEYTALDLGRNVPGLYELKVSTFVQGVADTVERKINFDLK